MPYYTKPIYLRVYLLTISKPPPRTHLFQSHGFFGKKKQNGSGESDGLLGGPVQNKSWGISRDAWTRMHPSSFIIPNKISMASISCHQYIQHHTTLIKTWQLEPSQRIDEHNGCPCQMTHAPPPSACKCNLDMRLSSKANSCWRLSKKLAILL